MKHYLFCIIFITSTCIAQDKLMLPLKGGNFSRKTGTEYNRNNGILVLCPKNDYQVRSAEETSIKAIWYVDSIIAIITQGNYRIEYMNLSKIYVKKGDKVKKGQIIGETLFVKDAPDAGILLLSIEKDGKNFTDINIFEP